MGTTSVRIIYTIYKSYIVHIYVRTVCALVHWRGNVGTIYLYYSDDIYLLYYYSVGDSVFMYYVVVGKTMFPASHYITWRFETTEWSNPL